MTVAWHCRTCDAKGTREISLTSIIAIRNKAEADKHFFTILQEQCAHECTGTPNVGVQLAKGKME